MQHEPFWLTISSCSSPDSLNFKWLYSWPVVSSKKVLKVDLHQLISRAENLLAFLPLLPIGNRNASIVSQVSHMESLLKHL